MVGIEELAEFPFKIYPNPTAEKLHIEGTLAIQSISIYNALGQWMQSEIKPSFSVQQLPRGTYHLIIETDTGIYTQIFLKQ